MKAINSILAVAGTALLAVPALAELDPIVIKGSKFFLESSGEQFFMRGVAYQQEFAAAGNGSTSEDNKYKDPLADADACKRDVPLLEELRTNTIRVYAVNPEEDHSECMKLLDDAGIYVIADLSEPALSINRDEPKWDVDLFNRYKDVVDVLAEYSNTLGFFAGNEVSNEMKNTNASAFVKAAVRDTKAYIKAKDYRPMGVGYATNDDAEIRADMEAYFNCGDTDESIDFWGYNIYSWCGDSSFKESGFDDRTEEFSEYTVPVFFAEYGCNEDPPRLFTEVEALYGEEMSPVWSGGIVYMYFQEDNDYGLVELDGDEAETLKDFSYLSKEMENVSPEGVKMDDYEPTNTVASSCPSVGSAWQAASVLPPTPDEELCECMAKSVSCTVSDDVDDEDIEELFGMVCGLDGEPCAGILADPAEGEYGAYSMCNPRQQLAFALDTYDRQQREEGNSGSCDFDGAAVEQEPDTSGDCESMVDEVGDGTDARPEAADEVVSGDSGSSDDSEDSAPASLSQTYFNIGSLQVGVYAVCAILSGAGMILL